MYNCSQAHQLYTTSCLCPTLRTNNKGLANHFGPHTNTGDLPETTKTTTRYSIHITGHYHTVSTQRTVNGVGQGSTTQVLNISMDAPTNTTALNTMDHWHLVLMGIAELFKTSKHHCPDKSPRLKDSRPRHLCGCPPTEKHK
jgi:hypothetical protein